MPLPILEPELLRNIDNLMGRAEHAGRPVRTDFLDAAAAESILTYVSKRFAGGIVLSGGHPSAERKMLILSPAGQDNPPDPADFIAALRVSPADKKAKLSHRDYLGSLMTLGLSRSRLGDIIVAQSSAYVLTAKDTAKIILTQLDRVAGTSAKVEEVTLGDIPSEVQEDAREQTISVSSLRLDCVVSGAFNMARSKAADAITRGFISVNWQEVLKPDRTLSEGDMIGFRGRGRAKIAKIGGLSRKGHTFLVLEVM